jgi:hypothetical protein
VRTFIVFLLLIVGAIISAIGARGHSPTTYAIGACALIVAVAGLQTWTRDKDKDAVWFGFTLTAAFLTFVGVTNHW